jgi:hypothetical protein
MNDQNHEKDQSDETRPPADGPVYRTLTPSGGAKPQPVAKPAATSAKAQPQPVPAPKSAETKEEAHSEPTRFGDWEIKGRCIDF